MIMLILNLRQNYINKNIERKIFTIFLCILISLIKINTHCVEEFGKFTKVVPPTSSCHPKAHRAI